MKLSNIDISDLTDEQINKIVFGGISDNGFNCDIAIVFGNSKMIKERANKVYEMYRKGRVRKVIFTGGINGISNDENDKVSEAEKMKLYAMKLGIKETDILLEDKSNNTFENIQFSLELIKINLDYDKIKNIMLISSDYHLKRCLGTLLKYVKEKEVTLIPVKNGYSDEENWFKSEKGWGTGRGIVSFEAEVLVKYARENKIYDLEIEGYK